MALPKTGTRHRFQADAGLAALHVDSLPAEMAELDLHPGTTVTVVGHDEGRGLLLVEWTDRAGNPRITSVEPDVFDEHFVKG